MVRCSGGANGLGWVCHSILPFAYGPCTPTVPDAESVAQVLDHLTYCVQAPPTSTSPS